MTDKAALWSRLGYARRKARIIIAILTNARDTVYPGSKLDQALLEAVRDARLLLNELEGIRATRDDCGPDHATQKALGAGLQPQR